MSTLPTYSKISAQKQLQRSNKIPEDWLIAPETLHGLTNFMNIPVSCGILNKIECKITSDFDATALVENLKAGIWSVEQVTIAFCKRAAIAQQLVSQAVPPG